MLKSIKGLFNRLYFKPTDKRRRDFFQPRVKDIPEQGAKGIENQIIDIRRPAHRKLTEFNEQGNPRSAKQRPEKPFFMPQESKKEPHWNKDPDIPHKANQDIQRIAIADFPQTIKENPKGDKINPQWPSISHQMNTRLRKLQFRDNRLGCKPCQKQDKQKQARLMIPVRQKILTEQSAISLSYQ